MTQPTPPAPQISVIVPVHNAGEDFQKCMEGIARSKRPPDEVIVVVDGAAGQAVEIAQRYDARVLLPDRDASGKAPPPRGPAHARNRGAAAASGDVLFFLDADVIAASDAVGRVAEHFAQDPDLAALIGSYDDAPGDPSFLSQYRNLLHHYTHQTGREEATTFWGACGAARRAAFADVGGFDERYPKPCIEDVELGYRMRLAGHPIRLDKHLQVKHLKRWEALGMLRTDVFQRALPWTALILERRQLPNDLNLNTNSRLSTVAAFVLLGAPLGTLAAAALGTRRPPKALTGGMAGAAALALLGLNAPLYRFLYRKRGLRFLLQALPWHWLYYAYSGAAFGAGLARHALGYRTHGRRANAADEHAAAQRRPAGLAASDFHAAPEASAAA